MNEQTPRTVIDITALPDCARVRLPVLTRTFAISQSTVRRWVQAGLLPKPTRLGRVISWRASDLKALLAGEVAQ
jgi:predicted DNA-binding transcriptional regulator AlpA